MFTQVLIWDGGAHCTVTVVVLEQITNKSVVGADVRVLGSSEERMMEILGGSHSEDWKRFVQECDVAVEGKTDNHGTAVLGAKCGAGGRKSVLGGKTGSYRIDHIFEIAHPKYEPLRIPLAALLGQNSFPLRRENKLTVRVWVEPKKMNVASDQEVQR
ncbi:hypothetical protein [Roseimicrobium sp. ORNL1]|uniref:hypothetical protein n=1 Tax=Roseimicrobium sp. ORNL1 TaxID=2711231 RepID=UPI0013E17554|nr:hypothetical protein [Roseimicrobium sp. ORNL1]QIF03774.1 hypothetical protein G5S37_20365 [Roseimicrobium sp. ORNL1]